MSEKLDQLHEAFANGEGFEIDGRIIFDPSWNKPTTELLTDEMVVTFLDEAETTE
jgi:hypothetical protein